jgi:alpha,alpha-trehalase
VGIEQAPHRLAHRGILRRGCPLRYLCLLALSVASSAPSASVGLGLESSPQPPEVLFKDLFVAVQTLHVFTDGKEFADAVPKSEPSQILAAYEQVKPRSAEEVKTFVETHFTLPNAVVAATASAQVVPIAEHIDRLWTELTRSTPQTPRYGSALALPRPYVVPGGRFREMYYWDSYFTMLGLAESGRSDLIEDMVRNFAYLIDTYGHVPNGTRTYYLSRSQPPFFFAMVELLSKEDPAASFARYLPELKREYAFWMQDAQGLTPGSARRHVVALSDGAILNRYWDDRDTPRDESYAQDVELASHSPRAASVVFRDIRAAAESGWDFGSRWFADPRDRATIDTTEIVPSDLNSLLFGLENAIRSGCVREFARRAAARRAAIDRYLWDPGQGAYLDYRWTRAERIVRVSAATLYPLFVSMASQAQADSVADTAMRQLLKPGGISTTALETGQQWDAPNGWAPLQWIAVSGLRRYGHDSFAEAIACRFMANVNDVYQQSGKLVEKYDVIHTGRKGGGGEYPTQDGFGWTNGVVRKLERQYPADAAYLNAAQCPSAASTGASSTQLSEAQHAREGADSPR